MRLVSLLVLGIALGGSAAATEPFVASTARSFKDLMSETMTRMHHGMSAAPQDGDPDHDFVTQMIPHHQGAIDMAKVLLVYGKDTALQQLAKGIIADQQNEIQVMQLWLARYDAKHAGTPKGKNP
ncbi:MAG TPA: DUF305 domain-containing protein [Myxococcales bacterium]